MKFKEFRDVFTFDHQLDLVIYFAEDVIPISVIVNDFEDKGYDPFYSHVWFIDVLPEYIDVFDDCLVLCIKKDYHSADTLNICLKGEIKCTKI